MRRTVFRGEGQSNFQLIAKETENALALGFQLYSLYLPPFDEDLSCLQGLCMKYTPFISVHTTLYMSHACILVFSLGNTF